MRVAPRKNRSVTKLLRTAALGGVLLAGCASPSPATADESDPLALLNESAKTLYAGDAAALDLTAVVRVVRGENENETRAEYRFERSGDAAFSLAPVFADDAPRDDGIEVRSDGELVLTHVFALGKYTLEESDAGVIAFIRSPLSQGIGSPLGGLGLSMLHPETTQELVSRVTDAEYVGEEPLGETPARRCRYTVDDQVTFDAWFSADGPTTVLRIAADLGELMAGGRAGTEKLGYNVAFEYALAADAELDAAAFKLREPEGAELVESFFRRSDDAPHRLLGQPAPAFELANLEGEPVNLADHLGKDVVVLDFWATWCPPCVAALPTIDRITASFAERGVVFYAVDQAEDPETVTSFLNAKDLNPPVLLDADSAASAAYDVEALPTSVLIGKDGTVQVVHVGFGGNLEAILTKELESLVAGDDLAAAKVAEGKRIAEQREANLARLRERLAD